MTSDDMWGDFSKETLEETPKKALMDQAALLGEKTKYSLEGSVQTQVPYYDTFRTTLAVIVPSLDNYVFDLVTIEHGVIIYPLKLIDEVEDRQWECADYETFKGHLREVLSSTKATKAIGRLLSLVAAKVSAQQMDTPYGTFQETYR